MTPCRECGVAVSTAAKTCPGCGAPKPARGPIVHALHRLANFCIVVGLVLTILMVLLL